MNSRIDFGPIQMNRAEQIEWAASLTPEARLQFYAKTMDFVMAVCPQLSQNLNPIETRPGVQIIKLRPDGDPPANICSEVKI